ncbi:MAG: alpha/beta hydrolase [Candidatus Diapherotrites archaeon]|nr:alpha/beta hydrolase [Candidatus Diapherotrites archaeon]
MKIFIIHGAYGNSQENWFPWLKQQLKQKGIEVIIPDFPTPQGQTLNSWEYALSKYIKEITPETVFIGHSLGCAFILSELEKAKLKIRACYLVSGFVGPLGLDLDKINKTFTEKDFDWSKIKNNCKKFVLFHSDNDPYVPLAKAKELKEKLNAELIITPKAGHFNKTAGFTEFPRLLNKIMELIK